jgi:predicted RecB family nuclease
MMKISDDPMCLKPCHAITEEIFEAFLNCPTKAFLYSNHAEKEANTDLTECQRCRREEFKEKSRERFLSTFQANECYIGTPPLEALRKPCYRAILDFAAVAPGICSHVHALEGSSPSTGAVDYSYLPVRFVCHEKLSASDKLLLAFDALALSRILGTPVRVGKIIHGSRYTAVRVPLTTLLGKAESILARIVAQQANATPPPLILNKHCSVCEFQMRCRQIAMGNDELSLLSNMSEKQRNRYHARGIFTVTQLSYTFRARKASNTALPNHHHALKALAIRKNQIHFLGTMVLNAPGMSVYFDVEGDPDRDFYYLIGLRIKSADSFIQHSFWANDPSDEREMWTDCLRALRSTENPRLIHYGSYETQFLKAMQSRYPNVEDSSFVEPLIASALNLLTVIYKQVYFPTYSNGLKEIAHYLGFRWSDDTPSGLKATMWRRQWDSSHERCLKERLLIYNAEDCEALQMVTDALTRIFEKTAPNRASAPDIVDVSSLKRQFPQRFGAVDFVLPEFQQINEAAYWDYQRNRVYIRSSQRMRRLGTRSNRKHSDKAIRVNKTVQVDDNRPAHCCRCGATLIYKFGRFSQTVYDLRMSSAVVKRWVVRYLFDRYICWHCKATFFQYAHKDKYGGTLCAYVLYQVIELQISQSAAGKALGQLFGLPKPRGIIKHIKSKESGRYKEAYQLILDRITRGKLVHADETKVRIEGKDAYVWVFTNLEDVGFVYSETREASTAQEVLRNFRGVLVSDFYTGYDSIACAQQKCLVHLMRDLNEDLCRQPFNEEMRQLSQEFASLLKPMVESVDRFGLKARYLRKHKPSVDRFYGWLSNRNYQTETASGYRKRFERNREKLFTFLEHDGVPWNNNNAEHAIKSFARLRNSISGKSSAKGIQEYLVLLSISETCKYRGLSFLDFLRSEEMDVDVLCAKGRS